LLNVIHDINKNYNNTNDTLSKTGPIIWTQSICKFMKINAKVDILKLIKNDIEPNGKIINYCYKNINYSLILLPYRAFGFHQLHGNDVIKIPKKQRLIRHMFEGSWK